MIDGRTPLHVFRSGSVTGQIYRDEVLDPYVRLFRVHMDVTFLFMDDNARPHRANLVDEFLEKNLWDYLGRAIARRHPPPRDVNGLKTALLEEWSLIPQTVINNVISSLKTRCDMCVRVREIIFHIKFKKIQERKPDLEEEIWGPVTSKLTGEVLGYARAGLSHTLGSSISLYHLGAWGNPLEVTGS
ncbi:transposable element Tcb2 transposase [Trichonephila clavipes]|nr:transposable element Tcb2 transposase [Trichonephila clavipes]